MSLKWRMPLACAVFALALYAQPATVTGRVFDVYHRPVRGSRVATMSRRTEAAGARIVAQASAIVDDAGMYRLTLPPGRYILAVLPPPQAVDFATVFPAYFQDAVEFDKAQPIDLGAGELRPFVDFLLLEVETHRLSGQVNGMEKHWRGAGVAVSYAAGFTDVLRTVLTDKFGHFEIDHLPAGSYTLEAFAPVSAADGVILSGGARSGSVRVDIRKPEIHGIQIHLRAAAR